MNNREDTIAQGFVQLLPLIYNTLSSEAMNSVPPKQADLTHLQSHILETLFHTAEGVSISDLARSMTISKQQMTPLLQKLEENGYITKIRDSHDKRSFKIMLSDTGKEVITKKWENLYHLFCTKLELLTEDEQIDFEYALMKIIRLLGKLKS